MLFWRIMWLALLIRSACRYDFIIGSCSLNCKITFIKTLEVLTTKCRWPSTFFILGQEFWIIYRQLIFVFFECLMAEIILVLVDVIFDLYFLLLDRLAASRLTTGRALTLLLLTQAQRHLAWERHCAFGFLSAVFAFDLFIGPNLYGCS